VYSLRLIRPLYRPTEDSLVVATFQKPTIFCNAMAGVPLIGRCLISLVG
jgi:hypothetical protein